MYTQCLKITRKVSFLKRITLKWERIENEVLKIRERLDFIQIVGRATHLDGHILDHVYVPKIMENHVEVKHHCVYYSDHDGILVNVKKR